MIFCKLMEWYSHPHNLALEIFPHSSMISCAIYSHFLSPLPAPDNPLLSLEICLFYICHRSGILQCVVFTVWFSSFITMLYHGSVFHSSLLLGSIPLCRNAIVCLLKRHFSCFTFCTYKYCFYIHSYKPAAGVYVFISLG